MDFAYKFHAVRGTQANKSYYIAMIPMRMLKKLFPDEEEYVPPEYRAQRKLNESRIPVISKYITENRDSYVFSALAASIDGEFSFNPSIPDSDVGMLEVSMDSRFLINDGQHRKAAIIEALEEEPDLGNETISVVLYEDAGLARSQQIFTDLNKHAVKTSNSISELYDSRDDIAVLTRNVVFEVPFLNVYTDKEKDNLGKYSSNLFTLNTFYRANKRIIGSKNLDENTETFIKNYWTCVALNMPQWRELTNKEISKQELREKYLATQGVIIQALGIVGSFFINNSDTNLSCFVSRLNNIDWARTAPCWKYRVVRADGKILTSNKAISLAANEIKKTIGIPLNEAELERENNFNAHFDA